VRITVDRDVCASAGMCALTAPDRFDQDEDDGRVLLLDPAAPDGEPDVERAAALCPTGAITLR
jgi:ferredoxin